MLVASGFARPCGGSIHEIIEQARPEPDIAGTARFTTMAVTCVAAFGILFLPLYYLAPSNLAVPAVEAVVAFVARRRGLRRTDAFVCVAGPPVIWAAVLLVSERHRLNEAPHDYVWIVSCIYAVMLAIAVCVGIAFGTRSRRRAAS